MIDRLIIHFGMHKTGTSSLQRFLGDRATELRASGVCFPAAGTMADQPDFPPGQHVLARAAIDSGGPEDPNFVRLAEQVRSEWGASSCPTLLLSSEDFGWIRHPQMLRDAFPAQRIDLYVSLRPQHEWLCAMYYTELLHSRTTVDPVAYAAGGIAPYLDYRRLLRTWRDAFPNAKLHVRPYEKGTPARRDAVGEFLRTLNLPLIPLPESQRLEVHPTLPARGIFALRTLNEMAVTPDDFYVCTRLLHLNRDLLGTESSVLSPEHRRAIHEEWRDANREVRREFVDGSDADLFIAPATDDEDTWQHDFGDQNALQRETLMQFARWALPIAQARAERRRERSLPQSGTV